MEKTRKTLLTLFIAMILMPLLLTVFFECTGIGEGMLAGIDSGTEFVVTFVMELATIICIPVALKLFKFSSVGKELTARKEEALQKWGTVRIVILGTLLTLNVLLYYLFMQSAFWYLALIILISMVFVYPGKGKCEEELYKTEE